MKTERKSHLHYIIYLLLCTLLSLPVFSGNPGKPPVLYKIKPTSEQGPISKLPSSIPPEELLQTNKKKQAPNPGPATFPKEEKNIALPSTPSGNGEKEKYKAFTPSGGNISGGIPDNYSSSSYSSIKGAESYQSISSLPVFANTTTSSSFSSSSRSLSYREPYEEENESFLRAFSSDEEMMLKAPPKPGDPGGNFNTPVNDSWMLILILSGIYVLSVYLFKKQDSVKSIVK